MKILNEAHVPDKITVNHLEKIAGKIFEANMITFSDDEFPVEGTEHNRALYLTVKCEDSVVSRVLVDNGSSANICPLYTLQKLKIGTERIHLNSVCVRGFDGGGKDSVGDIMLELSIGPVEFTMEFQVLDMVVSYNLLLGRPWIHAAKAVPSSLHQMVKFEWDSMPSGNPSKFGLGFTPTEKDVKKVKNLKQKVWSLPKPVLYISKSFVMPGDEKPPTSSIPKHVVDVDEELVKKFQSLFEEINMVEVGEGSSKADVQLVDPNVKLSNWEVTPLPTRKEFCDMTRMKNFHPSPKSQSNSEITIQEVEYDDEIEYDEEATFEEISKELKQFEEKPKPNLSETEAINLGDQDNVRETKISVHIEPRVKEEIIKTLFEYKDVFAWSYDDMPGLSTDLQKLRKFKTDMSVKIKEEITKQLTTKVIWVTRYPTWLANVVAVPKKDGKTRSKKQSNHVKDLRKFFQRLRRYNLKLNLVKCAFGVPSGKLLGFVVSRRGIEMDPSKIKAIQELPPPKNKTEVMSLFGRLNYISRFIAQLTTTCEPIFKPLKNNAIVKWTDECQKAFDKCHTSFLHYTPENGVYKGVLSN
ncbi:uncharacterized protein [Nicotiana sylvestris]|uniref:uncharacterized protein n=1 Tax=Nicotiana sylvestris TaxID=4096 RepID=UPI00388C84CD